MLSCSTEHFCSLTQAFSSLEWRLYSPILRYNSPQILCCFCRWYFIFHIYIRSSVVEAADVDYYVRILCNPTGVSKGEDAFVSYIIYSMSNTILVRNIYIIFCYDISALVLYIFSQYNTNIIKLTKHVS